MMPDETRDLIARLRRTESSNGFDGNAMMMQAVGSSVWLVNPDGPEAADRLASLEERERVLIERAVAFVRSYPVTKMVERVIPEHTDLTSMGREYLVPAKTITVKALSTFDDCANDLRTALSAGVRQND